MNKSVLEAINKFDMFSRSKKVTVALSGGADSVSLLYCLLDISSIYGLTVCAAHLNHCLRGEESNRDEAFVKELCQKLGVKLISERADIKKIARDMSCSEELAARKVRYDFLSRSADGGLVATAHTADDSLETVIFNLSRGSAAKGLCGIPPVRDNFIRPLIFCTRSQVEEYCREKSIEYVTDSTNLKDKYTRNKIRHNVVPVLREINPSVATTVMRTSQILAEEQDYMEKQTDLVVRKAYKDGKSDISILKAEHPAIVKRAIKEIFEKSFDCELESVHIEALYNALNFDTVVSMPQGVSAVIKNGFFCFQNGEKPRLTTYKTEIKKEKIKNVNNLFLKDTIDCDKISGGLVVRTKEQGDEIRLANRGVTKTLKKIFTEQKIPIVERKNLPVAVDDMGLIWVYGVGVADRVKVDNNTENVIIFESQKQ